MRRAETVLAILHDRGQRRLPVERVYRLLYQPDLYLRAYAKLYKNEGAMTPGATSETVDAMSLEKIHTIIESLRCERYRWTPVRRRYVDKQNGKQRPLGLPSWSDKLLQEVIRSLLDAYFEPQFSEHSHGFRPKRGCHTALQKVAQQGRGTKWFIEGDICSCFDKIDFSILLGILGKHFHDQRFLRLMQGLLEAGYLDDWTYHQTYSGVPQGSIIGPILSNLVLDKLDSFVVQELIPAYSCGKQRQRYAPYSTLLHKAHQARSAGDVATAKQLRQQAQRLPSLDPNDPDFRRLWYQRYADDFLLGFKGPKAEALEVKQQIARFLHDELKLELSEDKTLLTHARSQKANFLGYEVHVLHADNKHDRQGKRCINGRVGFQVPARVKKAYAAKYLRRAKPSHLAERVNNDAYSIISQYQAEYRGLVQYYRMAYNLHTFNHLKHIMEVSLVKTLAKKYKTSCSKIYRRYQATLETKEGPYKVLQVKQHRADKPPLYAHFGAVPLTWNKWVQLNDSKDNRIWNTRSEVVERLLAQTCELCGSAQSIEVHHVRKLSDLKPKGRKPRPEWMQIMAARRRKTLVVCQACHNKIHAGRYHGKALSR